MKKSLIYSFSCAMVLFSLSAVYVKAQEVKPWSVPDKYNTMKSTVKPGDADAITTGTNLWAKQCKSCHGIKGIGDGPKAATLKATPVDFSATAFQKQTDGAIYYKSFIGRDEMPNFEKIIISEYDRWALIAFIRTMGK